MMMRDQRGVIATGYIWLAGGIAVLALLVVLARVTTGYLDGVRAEAKKAGEDTCDAAYKLRDNDQLKAANARIKELQDTARTLERGHAAKLATITGQLNKEKADGKDRQAQFDVDIAAGRLVVRGAAFQAPSRPTDNGGGKVSASVTGSGRGDGKAACELSPAARSDLLATGDHADDTARLLAACQAIIEEDRRICGQ